MSLHKENILNNDSEGNILKENNYINLNNKFNDISVIYITDIIEINQNKNINIKNVELVDHSTQTDYNELYIEENEEEKTEPENPQNQTKKIRKYDTDLIRNKIFNHFNKMLYKWLLNTQPNDNNKAEIKQYHLVKINKDIISSLMDKYLKDLYLSHNSIDKISNKLLKNKLEYKYQILYDFFISGTHNINKDTEFFTNFTFLNNYLDKLRKKEDDEYIEKVKTVAMEYKQWLGGKAHLFKKK